MVDVHGSEVSIAAELKRESEEKQGKQLRTERVYGMQRRSFTLASEVDEDKVVARYADGVLSLVLPKKAGRAASRSRSTERRCHTMSTESLNPMPLVAPELLALDAEFSPLSMALAKVLLRRCSTREFGPGELSLYRLSRLLWAAFGINRPEQGCAPRRPPATCRTSRFTRRCAAACIATTPAGNCCSRCWRRTCGPPPAARTTWPKHRWT
jgi:hypothetical protein